MQLYVWWVVIGMALIIAELVTGTFFLLVIGVAALAGAGVAYFGYSFWAQATVVTAVAVVGVLLVHRFRATQRKTKGNSLDAGQSVILESWVSEKDRLARVRYRNASWDAKITDDAPVESGQMLYIQSVDGNTLHVSKTRPT